MCVCVIYGLWLLLVVTADWCVLLCFVLDYIYFPLHDFPAFISLPATSTWKEPNSHSPICLFSQLRDQIVNPIDWNMETCVWCVFVFPASFFILNIQGVRSNASLYNSMIHHIRLNLMHCTPQTFSSVIHAAGRIHYCTTPSLFPV